MPALVEAHHVQHWIDGGLTDLANVAEIDAAVPVAEPEEQPDHDYPDVIVIDDEDDGDLAVPDDSTVAIAG